MWLQVLGKTNTAAFRVGADFKCQIWLIFNPIADLVVAQHVVVAQNVVVAQHVVVAAVSGQHLSYPRKKSLKGEITLRRAWW